MSADDITRYALTALVVIGFGLVAMIALYAPGASPNDRTLIVGALITGYGTVLGYWFSKRSSQ